MSDSQHETPQIALHWAAVAVGLAEARTAKGMPLTDEERVHFDRYQQNAYDHGFSEEQVRGYLDNTLRPAIAAD
ncbi:hypothetical protein [Streptomyces luteocolor]|uniref:hypothetical protein n=1 Tax=Streptomyces luteocolor TaxID=285500 RepID=UPI000852A61C|nr:hypothetical protein [Streptomyces luteocolor]